MRSKLLPLTLLLLIQGAYAQQPTAGSQLQQIPVAPQLPKAAPAIRVQRGDVPAAIVGDSTRIKVERLQIAAPPVFAESELVAASGFVPGSELTLTELRGLASKIASYYQTRGYFLAQAYLPAQDIKDGVVQVTVLPGTYGQVQLRNKSNLSDGLAHNILSRPRRRSGRHHAAGTAPAAAVGLAGRAGQLDPGAGRVAWARPI